MTRRHWMKQSRQENLIYLAVWGLLFAAPLLSLYVRTVSDTNVAFDWTEVLLVWRKFAVFLLLFVVHNFLLAPLLVHGFAIVAAMIAAFTVYQCSSRPERRGPAPHMEQRGHHRSHFDEPPMAMDGERPPLPNERPPMDGERPPLPDDVPPMDGERPMDDKRPHRQFRPADGPPPIVGERDILAVVVLILMLGANLGIKSYFRSREDRKRLAELEKQNLEQQLEYLRYQINPHFFMNTLNNIHALVDIDPAKAQETILELSKMMRFVLYEGDKQGVPLTREFEFIRTYVTLMQLRYTDKVKISLDLPAEAPDKTIPPLMLISFVENAFKHGVSYQRESFIEVKIRVEEGRLSFMCRNSKADVPNEEKGGVGLANVRKRLNLLYDNDYTLRIKDAPDVYTVELVIPLNSKS